VTERGETMGRILALDPGAKRVGLALSDPLRIIASPLGTLERRGDRRLVEDLRALVEKHAVELVLVGFPVRDDGYEGEGCRRSRRILDLLASAGVPALLWDESSTTEQAYEVTGRHGMDRRKSRYAKDAVAASFILSSYLAEQDPRGPPDV
jgi:putative holliday junction resolvase